MDVHKENYTICSYDIESDSVKYQQKMKSDYKNILKYVERIQQIYGKGYDVICGYEAGCLGYSLYHQLTAHGINCVILAPSTMGLTDVKHIKTNRRDAAAIARCLAFRSYSEVYVPDKKDEAVKKYIRMRDAHNDTLKRMKKQILELTLRLGFNFDGRSYWTIKHMKWLKALNMDELFRETLDEYILTYEHLKDKVERLDERLRRRYYQMTLGKNKNSNIAKTAIARELSCFIWGMMTENIM